MVDQARRDVDDVSGALGQHLRDRGLGDVEEAGEVDGKHVGEVGSGVVGKRLCDEYPGVVHQRVDTAEPAQALLDDFSRGLRLRNVARDRQDIRIA